MNPGKDKLPSGCAIEAQALVVRYAEHPVIDRLDLRVEAGTVYALLGGNGAGKTTTLNTFLGFVRPASGGVWIGGEAPSSHGALVRDQVAYLPEQVALYDYLSGLENLRFFCALAGIDLAPERARELLLQAGLQAGAHGERAAGYSKGMRQKVGLAIASAKQARVMLLDEPTSGLDPSAANDFAQRLRGAAARGVAVLMATHDLFNAKQVADRIGIMQAGRLVEEFDAHTVGHDELEQKYLTHARGVA